jgi:predicted 3-demethylubiquinone-9 3-methyltransferase (glyoxalase superfamily)
LWEKLSKGAEKGQCSWLKDKYGLSWQIVLTVLGEMLNDTDTLKSQRVMKAILQMNKIDIKVYREHMNKDKTREDRSPLKLIFSLEP